MMNFLFIVVFVLYNCVMQLDFIGLYEVFWWLLGV